MLPEFETLGVKVVGTSVDSLGTLRRFRDKYELRFPLVSDSERTIGTAYGTLKSPTGSDERDTVVIDREGTVLLAYQRVGAKGHAATVLDDTRRLREEGRI